MKWLIGIVITIIVGIGALLIPQPVQIDESRILSRINGERYSKGLEVLTYDPQLEAGAQLRAERLCNSVFSHDNFMKELAESKYEYAYAGENLAQGNFTADEHVQAWIESETHYNNIIKPEYRQTGIGIADCKHTQIIVMWYGQKKTAE